MMNPTQFIGPVKYFVKGSEEQKNGSGNDDLNIKPRAAFVSGADVKQFYERVVGKGAFEASSKNDLEKKRVSVIEKGNNIVKIPFNINALMKAVETGNVKDVQKILNGNEDKVNCKDQFGWTPIMSACCAGDEVMVQSLLQRHPKLDIVDKKGNTCRSLASARGHSKIVEIIDKYTKEQRELMGKSTKLSSNHDSGQLLVAPFYCKTCKQSVENMSLKKHLSSTIHNFNAASKKKMPTMYGIPESNKGFQILVKSGWDKETGLGPSGEGHKFPPKTILKQDRTGLGAKQYKPRVTHSMEDVRREAKPKETFKRKLNSQKKKEQRLERNLRLMLS